MSIKRISFIRFLAGVLLALLASISFAESSTAYTFAVIPQFKPSQLQKEWTPVLQRISRETGVTLKLALAPSIVKFETELNKGIPDFAFMHPYEAVMSMKGKGYIPMLRSKNPLNGILVVRKDSPYKKLEDLDGKIIGFPSPNAFGASLYMRAKLSEENKIKFTPRYLNNHNVVYKHVSLGHIAAGGTTNTAFEDETPEMREQLTVLFQTPDVAPHPVSVHPRVPANVRKLVMQAFFAMQEDDEGRAMLKEIRMPNLVEANYKNDYQPLEKLNIDKYMVHEAD